MAGFEPGSSGAGSNQSFNCPKFQLFCFKSNLYPKDCLSFQNSKLDVALLKAVLGAKKGTRILKK